MNWVLDIARWIYSLFYIFIGSLGFLSRAGLISKPDFNISPESAAFQEALADTGFVIPIMLFTYIVAGLLMLPKRTTPLGIVLLAPFIIVILFNHLMLNGNPAWGILHAVLLVIFAWQFRSSYIPLWNH